MHNAPLMITLAALLPGGIDALKPSISRAIQKDDLSTALKEANQEYATQGAKSLEAALTYAILLTYRDLADEAAGVLRKTMEFHTHEPSFQLAQIDVLLALGEDESAQALMEGMKHVTFQDPGHIAYLGDLFLAVEMEDEAFDAYVKALDQGCTDPGVASHAALILGSQGRAEAAAEMYQRAAKLDPEDPEHWFMAAEAWMEAENFQHAADAYEKVLRMDDENPRLWLYYGVALSEAGEVEEALKAFDKARKLEPTEPENWLNVAHLLLEMGDVEEARRHYEKAAQLNPGDPEAVNGMVAAAFELGDVELAEQLARRAIEMDPENPDSLYNLGVIQLAMNHLVDAEDAFRGAIAMDYQDPRYSNSLALVLLRKGELGEALKLAEASVATAELDASGAFEFSQDLLRFGGADKLMDFLQKVRTYDPRWKVVQPLFEFIASGLRRESDEARRQVKIFVRELKSVPEVIPVEWDFEELERLGLGIEQADRKLLDTMIAVLEGRKDLSKLEGQLA